MKNEPVNDDPFSAEGATWPWVQLEDDPVLLRAAAEYLERHALDEEF